jgi:hypothetical protein
MVIHGVAEKKFMFSDPLRVFPDMLQKSTRKQKRSKAEQQTKTVNSWLGQLSGDKI